MAADVQRATVDSMRNRVMAAGAVGCSVIAAAGALLVPVGGRVIAGTAAPQERCTTRLDYAGDPRRAGMINAIGDSTGHCPTPIPQATGLPGLVDGATLGQPCYNFPRYVFGQSSDGTQLACIYLGADSATTGRWAASEPVVGVRNIGRPCSPQSGIAAQSPDGRPLICINSVWLKSLLAME